MAAEPHSLTREALKDLLESTLRAECRACCRAEAADRDLYAGSIGVLRRILDALEKCAEESKVIKLG